MKKKKIARARDSCLIVELFAYHRDGLFFARKLFGIRWDSKPHSPRVTPFLAQRIVLSKFLSLFFFFLSRSRDRVQIYISKTIYMNVLLFAVPHCTQSALSEKCIWKLVSFLNQQ